MKINIVRLIGIICAVVLFNTMLSFAESPIYDENNLTINNMSIISTDTGATYIEGFVKEAWGQKIVVKKGFSVVAERLMPESSNAQTFKIKIPAEYLNLKRVNVFRVEELDSGNRHVISKRRVEISIEDKEKQTIRVSEKYYNLTYPGENATITANATSGGKVSYTSSNPKIVTVDSKGNIKTEGAGEAEIKIKQIGSGRFYEAEETIKVSVKAIDAYTLTYHFGSGKDESITQIVNTGEPYVLKEKPFENEEHEFLGWARTADGLVEYADREEVIDLAQTGEKIDLYAVWTGDGARAAVAWAIKVANDDSFNYGTGDACHCAGCYFCGTNQRNKPKGYEKTYVCLTFVEAAYAHGAEDPEMLAECQAGRRCMAVNDSNFSRYSCWERVGYTSNLTVDDLEPGDVICFYSPGGYDNGHMEMYAGNNSIVDAAYEGWNSGTIALRPNQAASDLKAATRHNSNSYVMRYVGPNR